MLRAIIHKIFRNRYKESFEVACALLNGGVLYGIDSNELFRIIMEKEGSCMDLNFQRYIYKYLDRFSDYDYLRHKAIEKYGLNLEKV